jgi:hypothetical protein
VLNTRSKSQKGEGKIVDLIPEVEREL